MPVLLDLKLPKESGVLSRMHHPDAKHIAFMWSCYVAAVPADILRGQRVPQQRGKPVDRSEGIFYGLECADCSPSQIHDMGWCPGFTHREFALEGRAAAVDSGPFFRSNIDDVFIGFDLHLNSPYTV